MPVLVNELLWGSGMATISAILGHMGSAAVAANSVVQVTRQLAMVVTSLRCGRSHRGGAGENDRGGKGGSGKIYARRFVRLSFILGLCGGAVVLGVSPVDGIFWR